MIKSTTVV